LTQELIQEPQSTFFPEEPNKQVLTCSSTGRRLDPWSCFCCSGLNCWLKTGSYHRLLHDLKARPEYYGDKPYVYKAIRNPVPKAKIGISGEAS
jgi:hypothetical protein